MPLFSESKNEKKHYRLFCYDNVARRRIFLSPECPPTAQSGTQYAEGLGCSCLPGGKPIETLTPEEARKQPAPADAVKKLMKDQGKSTERLDHESTAP